eukprot:431442_1
MAALLLTVLMFTSDVNSDCDSDTIAPSCKENKEKGTEPSSTWKDNSKCGTEIMKCKKPNIPTPDKYFANEPMATHLGQFVSNDATPGAAYIVKNYVLEHFNYGRCEQTIGGPCDTTTYVGDSIGQFVSIPETYTSMLTDVSHDTCSSVTSCEQQYRKVFDEKLGFDPVWSFVAEDKIPPYQKSSMAIILIKIKTDASWIQNNKMRMASGNERGANDEWIPGGYLPKGQPEAVIDEIPKTAVTFSVIYEQGEKEQGHFLKEPKEYIPRKSVQCRELYKSQAIPPSNTFYKSECGTYIVNMKQTRPNPTKYFKQKDIQSHLQKFAIGNKGSAFVIRESEMMLKNFKNKFVNPLETYEKVLQEIHDKHDNTIFNHALGFSDKESYLGQDVILVVISPTIVKNMIASKTIQIASGNERGKKEGWIPGGFLKPSWKAKNEERDPFPEAFVSQRMRKQTLKMYIIYRHHGGVFEQTYDRQEITTGKQEVRGATGAVG